MNTKRQSKYKNNVKKYDERCEFAKFRKDNKLFGKHFAKSRAHALARNAVDN